MKKILLLLTILIIINSFDTKSISSDEGEVYKIIFNFNNLSIEEKSDNSVLTLDGTNSLLLKSNHYIIPTLTKTLTFAYKIEITDFKCIPKNIHRLSISKELIIAPQPVELGNYSFNKIKPEESEPFLINDWYDYKVGMGIVDKSRNTILKIQLFPIHYQPEDNIVEWAEQIELEIKYKKTDLLQSDINIYDFIIISPEKFTNELLELVNYKNNLEIKTKLVTLDEIYNGSYFQAKGRDDQEKIKYFIKDAIENWGISYVLLVGGADIFLVRIVVPQNSFVSDLYYADIYDGEGNFCNWNTDEDTFYGEYNQDDVDLFPDVYLGRLACINKTQVKICVNKIINYELEDIYKQQWFNNFTVVAGDCFPSEGICEGESATQKACEIMNNFKPDRIWASNGRLEGTNPTGVEEITNSINKGCGFFYFSGHSSPTIFFTFACNDNSRKLPTPTGYYSNDYISDLENYNKIPIVIFDSCSPSKFDKFDDCIGWSFLSNKNGGGIGFFGATTTSLCYLGEQFTEGLAIKLALNVFNVYKNKNISYIGQLWNDAIVEYIFPNMTVADYITLEQWEPFFDPTLSIKKISKAPETPQKPIGTTSGKINTEYNFTSSTTDPEGDFLYFLFDWDDGTNSGWIGPIKSGEICKASHIWNKKSDYKIRVKAKDIFGFESDWSDSLNVEMSKNKYFNSLFISKLFYRLSCLYQSFN